jgi:hypothetical protein
MIKTFTLSILLLAAAAITANGQSSTGEPNNSQPASTPTPNRKPLDLGRLDGTAYANNFFGLSLSIPRDWVVLDVQRHKEIIEESKKMASQEEEKRKKQFNESIDRSTILLSLLKLPAGQPGNASFMVIAERVPADRIRTGVDVLRTIETYGKTGNVRLEFQDAIRTEQIGGTEFAVGTIKNSSPQGTFMQKVYVTTMHGYGLQFFFTYLDAADLRTFDSIMKTVNIKPA